MHYGGIFAFHEGEKRDMNQRRKKVYFHILWFKFKTALSFFAFIGCLRLRNFNIPQEGKKLRI